MYWDELPCALECQRASLGVCGWHEESTVSLSVNVSASLSLTVVKAVC